MREEPLRIRFRIAAAFACMGCLVAIGWLVAMDPPRVAEGGSGALSLLGAMFSDDPLTRLAKVALVALALCTIVISMEGNFTAHVGEYLALILLATIGTMFLVSSADLLRIV